MKTIKHYLGVALKGMGMGAADVVPGVSGGTIAFMTGIYEELVGSLNNVNMKAVKLLFTGKFKEFWNHINGKFICSLMLGIVISVISLAKLMTYLLEIHPIQTWAFFFGLIVASSIFMIRDIKGWNLKEILFIAFGVVLGVTVCTLSPTQTPEGLWFIFISGALAICAMILPGISGSFILLILGKYHFILKQVDEMTSGVFGRNVLIIMVFVLGCIVGILAFSKFLHWLLGKWEKETLIVLIGFIMGSLVKVWPWSDQAALAEAQVLRGGLPAPLDLQIPSALIFFALGLTLVSMLQFLSAKASAGKKQA